MKIRPLSESDIAAAMRLKEAAGWNQTEADWKRVLRLAPGGCFVLEHDGVVAASTTAVCYGEDLAWIGMVLTLPEYRGKGFAHALIEHSLEYLKTCRVSWVKLDATPMGIGVYTDFGFETETTVERWLRAGQRGSCAGSPASLNEFHYSLDRQAFGACRRDIIKDLQASGTSQQGGYLLTRPGSEAAYLGPCVAEDAATARALLTGALAQHEGKALYWDLLPDNKESRQMAAEFGFQKIRTLSRMALRLRADAPPLQPRAELVYALAGFEFG